MMHLPARPREDSDLVHVVVDTPKGSRNKYKFDETHGCFRLSRILPAGASFPMNFGYIPGTRGEDGDAIDVLLIMDDPMPVGLLLEARLIGVLSAKQTQDGQTIRNDRLLAVPVTEVNPASLNDLSEVAERVLDELEHFFISYNRAHGRTFEPCGRLGRDEAEKIVESSVESEPQQ